MTDLDFLARLLALVERSSVRELELTQGETRIRIVKNADGTRLATPSAHTPDEMPAVRENSRRHEIRAGFPGTFYCASAPDQPPFVEVGTTVEDGRILGILEAMKTMNPVEADRAGVVREIAASNGEAVEAGALLFVIEAEK